MTGKQLIFPVLMVLAVTFGAYLPSLDNGFTNYDDPVAYYLKKNYPLSYKHYDAALSLGFIPEPRFAKKMRPRKR